MTKRLLLVSLLALGNCATSQAGEALTHADLVRQMIDLERLAVLPQPGERNAMWASNDRRSRYDEAAGKYVHWHANGDGTGWIRKEGDAIVMAEMQGPGVIWRIWSAKPQAGHVKVYLDGAEQPAIDKPFAHYFDARHAPFDYPTLGYVAAKGHNLYFPIPYQKSCKVVGEKGWGRYYQFTYTTFSEGTVVPTFSTELTAEAREALQAVDAFFRERLGTDPAGERPGQKTVERKVAVQPGQTATVVALDGPQAITCLRVQMELTDRGEQMAALRGLVLRITWDGGEEPAVWCPLGDFFGTAPGVNLYKSLPCGMTEDGFYSCWYMPFAKAARVELANEGAVAREAAFTVTHAPLRRPFDGLGHFHCKWHRDLEPLPKDRWPDWTVLETEGRGRFCGMMLHVWNPRGGQCLAAGEGRWWWGEGDEKFFVDGETFPSTFGTGTEDYFGYAWCTPALFQRPYHCQTMTEGNRGHQSVNRWQIVDSVPFQKGFHACLEKYFPNEQPTLFAATAVWYLAPGGKDPIGETPVAERHGYYHRPPPYAGGFTMAKAPPGQVRTQNMAVFKTGKWTNNDHLWWTHAKPGDKLDIELPVKKAGRYGLQVVLTKANDYAIVQFHLDGKKIGAPIDLYSEAVTNTEPISLGTQGLTAGKHILTIEIVGANEKARKSYMVGLDTIKLVPAP